MAQKKKRKAVRVLGIVLPLGLLIVVGVIFFTKQGTKEKENRTARVISTQGNVVIQRVRADDTQAYTSMELESGDIIVTGADSGITMVLDEDKRIVLDENTKVLLQLSGTKTAGKTGLYLEYGAVLSDIEEKLTPESSYEVVTEASTMSVRGTRFEVVYQEVRDAAGNVSGMETKVLTFSGAVYVEPEGDAAPRMSRTGTIEVLTETEPGRYEFYGATKIIEASDLRTYSAEYLKQALEDDHKVLSEEEREQQEYLLNEIEQYIETVMPEKSEQSDDTDEVVTPALTGVPSPSPSPSPSPTPSPSPSPTLSPIPTRATLPTPTARPGVSPVVTPTEKPDHIPSPTPVPKTSPNPTATPEIQETLTVRYFIPLVMRDLNSMVAGDVFDVMSQLSVYEIPKNGTSSETALVHQAASDVLMKAAASYVNDGRVKDSAVTAYGAGTTVLCDGFYDTKGNFYHTSETSSFESYGWNTGDTVELYAAYTVYSSEGTYSYVPCTLKADIKVLFISYKNNYMMGMPVGETVLLPEVDGFTLQWKSGPNQSGDSIRIDGGGINSAHLSVKMK